jgi:hypothetical protein
MRAVISVFCITVLMVMGTLQHSVEGEFFLDKTQHNQSFSPVISDADESENYTLVYQLEIPDVANHNSAAISYSIDNSSQIDFSFDRVAYHLELQKNGEDRIYVYVSFPALTADIEEVGVPHYDAGIVYQQLIEDLHISSNHPNLSSIVSSDSGVIEFWPSNYATGNEIGVPGADSGTHDFGDDSASGAGYGSMQIHDYNSGQTLFSYSGWGYDGVNDLGIGNNPDSSGNPDWTFASNSDDYELKSMRIMVREGPPIPGIYVDIDSPQSHQIIQRQGNDIGQLPISGHIDYDYDFVSARMIEIDSNGSNISTPSEWHTIHSSFKAGGTFFKNIDVNTGWYKMELQISNQGSLIETITVEPIGVGEVFIIAGQSNSANHGNTTLTPSDSRVSTWGADGWRFATDPLPIATGNGGSPWPALGDNLALRYDVPIGLISVGWGGTRVEQWLPDDSSSNPLFDRITMALDEVGYLGARAILWHQGESDLASGTRTEDYTSMLNEVIMGSRIAAGWDIPWVVARASYLPGFSAESLAVIVDAQQTVIDNDSLTYLGPDTDNLIGDSWRYDTVHFNGEGLREHARLWDISISVMMEDFLGWDDDGDGVENTQDDCEDTPLGEPTYADGCSDSQRDSDNDGVSDDVDLCPGFDDALDLDLDGIPDDCDTIIDSDGDGVADNMDKCEGYDDSIDIDMDSIPDGCDSIIDSDGDGVADNLDECEGYDDSIDIDMDSIPDGCDSILDNDGDGVNNSIDLCEGHDDLIDLDFDSIPDGCDSIIDSDDDGVADISDKCAGFDDAIDNDNDAIPDDCDSLIDSDFDGVVDEEDICPGFDDLIDLDSDSIPDGCDSYIEDSSTEESSSSSTSFTSAIGVGLLLILVAMLAAMMIRKGGGGSEKELLDSETFFDMAEKTQKPLFDDGPDPSLIGEIKDNFEWVEHPIGSGVWYFKDKETLLWIKH